jgi:hypothetical protein
MSSTGGQASAGVPLVGGRSLVGVEFALPRDFPAERTLAVVAFQQGHQAVVDRWIARAVAAGVPATIRGAADVLPVAVVELPVLSTRWQLARRFIDGGMAAGIGDPDVLARTITLYTDLAAFRQPLAIADGRDVHALVVTRDGTVLARAQGSPDDASWAVIAAALA